MAKEKPIVLDDEKRVLTLEDDQKQVSNVREELKQGVYPVDEILMKVFDTAIKAIEIDDIEGGEGIENIEDI